MEKGFPGLFWTRYVFWEENVADRLFSQSIISTTTRAEASITKEISYTIGRNPNWNSEIQAEI